MPSKPKDYADAFIEHLKDENAYLRKDNDFLKGKCERLELKVLEPVGIQTLRAPIEQPKVKTEQKTAFNRDKDWWNGLSEQQQQEILDGRTQ